MSIRILITGSRDWRGPGMAAALFSGIREFGGDDRNVTVVHGAATGADEHAAAAAEIHEFTVEPYPAPWQAPCLGPDRLDPLTGDPWCEPGHRKPRRGGGDYCPSAGPRRNQQMVDLGADVCLAFPLASSRGTWDCVRRAETASIPVRVFGRYR